MVIAWPINLNVSCKLHPYSLQRTRSPPEPLLPKRIRNTHSCNYYHLKGKDIGVYFSLEVEELYCELNSLFLFFLFCNSQRIIFIKIRIILGHLINKKNFWKKRKIIFFYWIFFHKCKLCIVWNWFIAKIIFVSFEVVQNGGKPNNLSGLNWGYHQIFGCWDVQTKLNLQKNIWCFFFYH